MLRCSKGWCESSALCAPGVRNSIATEALGFAHKLPTCGEAVRFKEQASEASQVGMRTLASHGFVPALQLLSLGILAVRGGFSSCEASLQFGSSTSDCNIYEHVPFSGALFQQMAGKVNSTEACAALCAGAALQGCEAFIFCKSDQTSHEVGLSVDFCMLLHTVQEVQGDRSPFPGRCSSGRTCASDCRDLDPQLSLVFPDADASLVSSCSALIDRQPGNCWSSWNDGKREETTDPDIRIVQALCPESCRSCSNASVEGTSRSGNRGHATVAAAELARMTASVPATARCTIERQIAYQDESGYFFKWRAVLSAETCASLCASSPECLAFTFYVADQSDFSKFDCVLHNYICQHTWSSGRLLLSLWTSLCCAMHQPGSIRPLLVAKQCFLACYGRKVVQLLHSKGPHMKFYLPYCRLNCPC